MNRKIVRNNFENLSDSQHMWRIVKLRFRPHLSQFKGLTNNINEIINDSQKISDQLENYFESHFSKPMQIVKLPKTLVEPLGIEGVCRQWLKISAKKSFEILGLSAFVLECLPIG